MISSIKLPFIFEPGELKNDLAKIDDDEWTGHFNKSVYEGEWSGVPLRAPAGATHPIQKLNPNPGITEYVNTEILERCSYFQFVLNQFQCPLLSVRLLKLDPGSVIKEHSDYFLAFEEGEARIHIPVQTNPDLFFYLDKKRIIMNEGETWYLNFNLIHSIENHGSAPRVHLILDCKVNPWLENIFYTSNKSNTN